MTGEDIRFGSYRGLRGAAVHVSVEGCDWWLRSAEAVQLDGGPERWICVTDFIESVSGNTESLVRGGGITEWFAEAAEAGLQIAKPTMPVHLDMIAAYQESRLSVGYPFAIRQQNCQIVCGFSGSGPEHCICEAIAKAVASRLSQTSRISEPCVDNNRRAAD